MKRLLTLTLLFAVSLFAGCDGAPSEEEAKAAQNAKLKAETPEAFFERINALAAAFDPAFVDAYSDKAVIKNTRVYPNGQRRQITIPGAKWKPMLRKALPAAKARNDTNSYKTVVFNEEAGGVRIMGIRHSDLKNYDAPFSSLISRDGQGHWKIVEEIGESRP